MTGVLVADLTPANAVDKLAALFEAISETSYLGERVTIAEHMLQAAALARRDGASDELVAAALLHDIGYYADPNPDNANEGDRKKRHDMAAARVLSAVFPADVTEPIRLHVDAKRYLCCVAPDYRKQLSAASIHTMRLQGGAMSRNEADSFAAEPYCEDAVRLRHWDDEGKEPDAEVPGFASYRAMLERLVAHKSSI
jgi:gamma-butyrobetaine dioxygenase